MPSKIKELQETVIMLQKQIDDMNKRLKGCVTETRSNWKEIYNLRENYTQHLENTKPPSKFKVGDTVIGTHDFLLKEIAFVDEVIYVPFQHTYIYKLRLQDREIIERWEGNLQAIKPRKRK